MKWGKEMIPLVDLKAEYNILKNEINKELSEVLESGSFILGPKGKELEESIAGFLGVSYSVGVGNGTDALLLALEALEIGEGDEVITTPFTFFATAEVIARVGATPVFVDIEPTTFNMDPSKVEEAITNKTKAILVVHLFGQAADMDSIVAIAKKYQLFIVEDACQSIGATYKGKKVGSLGDIACFSFFPSKNLGCYGDGGLVVTNDQVLFEKVKLLRNHGSIHKYVNLEIGMNSRLDEMQAAILKVKFKRLEEFNENRRIVAQKYSSELAGSVCTPSIQPNRDHVFHQYCIQLSQRDKLAAYLHENNVATAVYYPIPLHLQKALQYLGYKEKQFPVTEEVSKNILALPVHPFMTQYQQDYIISSIKKFVGELN